MGTFLFHELVFGPVYSRRLGTSLGLNVLPLQSKLCNFNCIYCECGLTPEKYSAKPLLPGRHEIKTALENKLIELKNSNKKIDSITFAGNGEPTLHPNFIEIVNDTINLRNFYFPDTLVSVLTNATTLGNKDVFDALMKTDKKILKVDSGIKETIHSLNRPPENFSIKELIKNIQQFKGHCTIQSMFVKGFYEGKYIDNTTPQEIEAWLKVIEKTMPEELMIYTIDRDTPYESLRKIDKMKLLEIAQKADKFGIKVYVSG